MMVTDLALRDMSDRSDATLQRFCRWLLAPFRSGSKVAASMPPALQSATQSAASGSIQPLQSVDDLPEPIDLARHRAGTAARRAMQLAQNHRFDEARSAFHAAMVADPRLDPGSLPGFWDLPRRGMFSAIEACEDLGRYHAAALLEVRILQASRPVKVALRGSSAAIATR